MTIILNRKLCDNAPECGGIAVCPVGAFYYDEKKMQVMIDNDKCIECLKCTLPDTCPVGCILYARNEEEEKRIKKMINSDPRSSKWLWKARYGCEAAITPPKEKVINENNFEEILEKKGLKLIDLWHYDFLDCRLHSPLFEEILNGIQKEIKICKLNAQEFSKLAKRLNVSKFPTLILLDKNNEIYRYEGLLENKKKFITKINQDIKNAIDKAS